MVPNGISERVIVRVIVGYVAISTENVKLCREHSVIRIACSDVRDVGVVPERILRYGRADSGSRCTCSCFLQFQTRHSSDGHGSLATIKCPGDPLRGSPSDAALPAR